MLRTIVATSSRPTTAHSAEPLPRSGSYPVVSSIQSLHTRVRTKRRLLRAASTASIQNRAPSRRVMAILSPFGIGRSGGRQAPPLVSLGVLCRGGRWLCLRLHGLRRGRRTGRPVRRLGHLDRAVSDDDAADILAANLEEP